MARESLDLLRDIEGAGESGWVLGSIAEIARQRGQLALARQYIYQSLHEASGPLGMVTIVLGLIIYVNLLLDEGQIVEAAEIGVMLDSLPICGRSMATQSYYVTPVVKIMEMLPSDAAAQAAARGRARELQETAATVMVELEVGDWVTAD